MVDTTEPVPSDPIGVRRRALKGSMWEEIVEFVASDTPPQVVELADRLGLDDETLAAVLDEIRDVCENKAYNYMVRRDTGSR